MAWTRVGGVRDAPFARVEAARLNELRNGALEDRIDAELVLGRHAQVVAELDTLISSEPLRERRWGQSMLALYRSGRQADALRSYQRLRELLAEELGIEPNAELRALEEAMVLQKPELDWTPYSRSGGIATATTGASTQSAPAGRHNLPAALTTFVGRALEVVEVEELISVNRLVTLTGVGGGGKTRLAFHVAASLVGQFSDGVWVVELAPLGDGRLLPGAVARALGLHDFGSREPAGVLEDFLRDREVLLVVDNCEHIAEPAAALIRQLLEAAVNLKVLATSRHHLALAGEVRYSVPPMASADGAQLFVDRIGDVRPGVALDHDGLDAVADICRKVDGIPLALELAAARASVLSLAEIADKLDQGLGLLRGRGGGGPARHQTLEAAIDWGYRLLSPAGQTMLGRLSVFAGDWDLAAAEAIGGLDLPDSSLDLLDELVSNSFVQADVAGRAARYRLLEPIRQYAGAKLRSVGDDKEIRNRHLGWYLDRAEQIEPRIYGDDPAAWLAQLEADMDNMRAAMAWSIQSASADAGQRLVHALYMFFYIRANFREGLAWSQQVLELPGPPTGIRSGVSRRAGILARCIGDFSRARRYYAQAVDLSRASGDRRHLGRALSSISDLDLHDGDLGMAASHLEEAIALGTDTGDAFFVARSRAMLATVACHQGQLAKARNLANSVLDAAGQDDWIPRANVMFVLAEVAHDEGSYEVAQAYANEAIALTAALGGQNQRFTQVGLIAMAEGRVADAKAALDAAVDSETAISDEPYTPLIASRAFLAVIEGDTTAGLDVLDQAVQKARSRAHVVELIEVLVLHGEAHLRAGDPAGGRDTLQDAVVTAHRSGMVRALPGAMEALAACLTAEQSVAAATRAARLLGVAAALRARMGATPSPDRQWITETALSAVADVLGPDQAEAIRSTASQLDSDAVLAEVATPGAVL